MMMSMILQKAREKFPDAALIMKHSHDKLKGDVYKVMTYKRGLVAYAWVEDEKPGFIEIIKDEASLWIDSLEAIARARFDVENVRLSRK